MRPIDLVLSKVKAKPRSGGWHDFRCPAHDDSTASACVREDQHGHAQLKCFAGCTTEAICTALGLTVQDLFAKNGHARRDEKIIYEYTNLKGEIYYQVIRMPGKQFFQRRPDGKGGWINNLIGIIPVPYRLHLIPAAIKAGETIYICEGEKDVHAVCAAGGFATCNSGGAGKWDAGYSKIFTGARVVIIADKDAKGESHALDVKDKLTGFASSIAIVQAKTGKDAYDHLAAGNSLSDFVPFVPGAFETETFGENFELVTVDYLWKPYWPLGKCCLFDADGGTGKTAVLIGAAANFSNGRLPVSGESCEPIRTLYLHRGEDPSAELHTVYLANLGKPSMIEYLNNSALLFDAAGIERLRATIVKGSFKLVIVDALYYFLQGVVRDVSVALDVLPVMERLTRLAKELHITVINIRHTTKGTIDKAASDLGMGSVQFRNSHRGQLVARYHPEERGLVVVTDEKGSLLVERGEPFGFRRIGRFGEIHWVPDVENPFERKRSGGSRGPEASAQEAAAEAIVAFLKLKPNFEAPANEIVAHTIEELGCHRATVFRARSLLNLQARTEDGKKLWSLDILAEGEDYWRRN